MDSMIVKVRDDVLIPVHTEIDRSDSVKVADYFTNNGNVAIYTKAHRTFFIVEFFGQRILILAEDVLESLRTIKYLKQCGLSRGDCP